MSAATTAARRRTPVTGGDTQTEQASAGQVYEAGDYSNDSYSLSSYALSDSGGDPVNIRSQGHVNVLVDPAQTSGTESIDFWTVYNGNGSFARTGSGSDGSGPGRGRTVGTCRNRAVPSRRRFRPVQLWIFGAGERQRFGQ